MMLTRMGAIRYGYRLINLLTYKGILLIDYCRILISSPREKMARRLPLQRTIPSLSAPPGRSDRSIDNRDTMRFETYLKEQVRVKHQPSYRQSRRKRLRRPPRKFLVLVSLAFPLQRLMQMQNLSMSLLESLLPKLISMKVCYLNGFIVAELTLQTCLKTTSRGEDQGQISVTTLTMVSTSSPGHFMQANKSLYGLSTTRRRLH